MTGAISHGWTAIERHASGSAAQGEQAQASCLKATEAEAKVVSNDGEDPKRERWLAERLAFWQRQLRLQDWDLTAEFSTQVEIGGKSGLTWMEPSGKEARIRIMRREEWPPPSERYGTWDEELFLIHELVHLHMWAWKGADQKGDPDWENKEQAIDLMAGALVRLDRGERR